MSRSCVKITPEFFSINHLQYYTETRYAFLQDVPPEQAQDFTGGLPSAVRPDSDRELRSDQRQEIKKRRAYLATAAMEMIYGNYQEALDALDYAEQGYRKYFTREHISRLEISSFRALLLLLNSMPEEAEGLCNRVLSILCEDYGYGHPLALATTSIMVHVQLKEWKFSAALKTAESLATKTIESLGQDAMLAFHNKTLLAAAEYYMAKYRNAETDLKSVLPVFERNLEAEHPDTFQYQCLLARIHLKGGRFDAAEKRLVPALETKLREYSESSGSGGAPQVIEHKLGNFLNIFVKNPREAFAGNTPHPQFLDALTVYADILFQQKSESEFAISIHRAVWSQQKAVLGDTHLDTVTTLCRHAVLTRETHQDLETYDKVREKLKAVTKARRVTLGKSHVATLSSIREDLMLGFSIKSLRSPGPSSKDEKNIDYFQGMEPLEWSRHIHNTHESRLGRYHPETIQSRLGLFKLQLSKGFNYPTEESMNSILFGTGELRDECPIFALSTDCNISFIIYELGHDDFAKELATRATRTIDLYLEHGDIRARKYVERLRDENLGFIDYLNSRLKEAKR
ncbi:hypothetical protein ABKA04_004764 [Annulohypoxylon sp. FPYF3050]